uniref:Uncharacterized protein n=1 Tax=Avena sativa TaxID=4498 RepID=A0ACD5WG94_AVESA
MMAAPRRMTSPSIFEKRSYTWITGASPLSKTRSPKGVSFPGPEVCQALDKLWLSRGYSLPQPCTDGLSRSEICVRSILYWPDGTRKSFNPTDRRNVNLMVHSLLDRYNEDHHLSGDLAYELEDVVSFSEIYDRGFKRRHVFYHINFTTKNKGPEGLHSGDDGNLFFAEITCLIGENEEYVLDCLCVVKPDDKGQCYGCKNFGSVDLKHPTDAHKYKRGHSKPYPRCCGFDLPREMLDGFCTYRDEDTRLAAEESRLRRIYKCLDDPVFVAKLDDERKAADVGSSKREDNQGKGLAKYVVPARRRQLR